MKSPCQSYMRLLFSWKDKKNQVFLRFFFYVFTLQCVLTALRVCMWLFNGCILCACAIGSVLAIKMCLFMWFLIYNATHSRATVCLRNPQTEIGTWKFESLMLCSSKQSEAFMRIGPLGLCVCCSKSTKQMLVSFVFFLD